MSGLWGWICCLLLWLGLEGANADWLYFSGNLEGNCFIAARAYPPLQLKWRFRAQGGFYFPPTISQGIVYAGSRDYNVYAVDAKTGTALWSFHTQGEVYGGVTPGGDKVFATSADGHLYALNARTGQLLWKYPLEGILYAPALYADGIVCVGSGEGTLLHAINAQTGERLWTFPMGGRMGSAMAARDGVVYVGSYDRRLYALDLRTGKPLWSFEGHGYFDSCPLVAEKVVYAKTPDDVIYALDRQTGKPLWTYDPWEAPEWATQTINWSPLALVGDELLLFASNNRYVGALDLKTRTLRWRQEFQEDVASAPLVVGEVAYLGTKDGNIYVLSVRTGQPIWSQKRTTPPSQEFLRGYMWPPALDQGVLYFSSLDGFLEAYETQPTLNEELQAALEGKTLPPPPPANIFGQIERE